MVYYQIDQTTAGRSLVPLLTLLIQALGQALAQLPPILLLGSSHFVGTAYLQRYCSPNPAFSLTLLKTRQCLYSTCICLQWSLGLSGTLLGPRHATMFCTLDHLLGCGRVWMEHWYALRRRTCFRWPLATP